MFSVRFLISLDGAKVKARKVIVMIEFRKKEKGNYYMWLGKVHFMMLNVAVHNKSITIINTVCFKRNSNSIDEVKVTENIK